MTKARKVEPPKSVTLDMMRPLYRRLWTEWERRRDASEDIPRPTISSVIRDILDQALPR